MSVGIDLNALKSGFATITETCANFPLWPGIGCQIVATDLGERRQKPGRAEKTGLQVVVIGREFFDFVAEAGKRGIISYSGDPEGED